MKKDKARDIARGVLPSTARKGARDNKQNFHSSHRGTQRQTNHSIVRHLSTVTEHGTIGTDLDLFDDYEDREIFDGYHAATKKTNPGHDMDDIVYRRRGADKLGPLISWARATEREKMDGWDVADKIAYFKAVLPDTLQGRHALGHVQQALSLHADEFLYGYRYNRPAPITKEGLRASLVRHLATSKGRTDLHEFRLATVPVAAHLAHANNATKSQVQARDENGKLIWLPEHLTPGRPGYLPRRPKMVDVLIPQTVRVTCDDCSFLRNDPLASPQAINRFVDILWAGRHRWDRRRNSISGDHTFIPQIIDHLREDVV